MAGGLAAKEKIDREGENYGPQDLIDQLNDPHVDAALESAPFHGPEYAADLVASDAVAVTHDDTVPPLLFERMAARDPERTNQIFRKLLGRKHFDWAIGEKLMRQRKPAHFDRPRLPRIVPLSDKLTPYAAGA